MTFCTQGFGWQLTDMPEMNYVIARTVDVDDRQMPRERGGWRGLGRRYFLPR